MPKTERRFDPCGKNFILGMPEGYAPPKIVRKAMIESFGVLGFNLLRHTFQVLLAVFHDMEEAH